MKNITFVFSFFISFIAHAQQDSLKISVSEIFKNEKYKTSLLFAKEDANGDIFVVRNYYSSISNPKGYYVEHYDKDLKLLKRTTIEVDRNEIKGLFLNEDSVILLQFQYIQKEKKYAFATLTSPKNEFNFTEKEIYSIDRDRLDKYDHFGIRSEPEFNVYRKNNLGDIVESENGEFIAINLFTKSKKSDALHIITFNKNFEKLYEYEFENHFSIDGEPEKELPVDYQNMVLDNQGSAFILARIFKTDDEDLEKHDAPNYNFILYKGTKITKTKNLIPVESNNIIRSLHLITKNDEMAAVGFYSEKDDLGLFSNGNSYEGVVRFNLEKDSLSKLSESFQPFSEDFIIKKYGKMDDKNKLFIKYRNVFMTKSGDAIINAEEFELYIPNNRSLQTERIYKDIITYSIDNKGNLLWAKNINKKQKAWSLNNIPFFSYTATIKNNVSYYLVNSPSEVVLKNNQLELGEGKRLYVLKIFENGAFRYEKPMFKSIYNAQLETRFGVLINKEDILMQAESEDKPLLVKFYF